MKSLYQSVREEGSDVRLHPNGFIQISMSDGTRLHIWDPDLPVKAQKINTQIHDHRFSFVSEVLLGEITNVVYEPDMGDDVVEDAEEYRAYDIYVTKTRHGEDTMLERIGDEIAMGVNRRQKVPRGTRYRFDFGQFHETAYDALCITRMTKIHNEPLWRPRVLCLKDRRPDNDFNRYQYSEDTLWAIVERALIVWAHPVREPVDA